MAELWRRAAGPGPRKRAVFLKEHPDIRGKLESALRKKLGLANPAAPAEAAPAPAEKANGAGKARRSAAPRDAGAAGAAHGAARSTSEDRPLGPRMKPGRPTCQYLFGNKKHAGRSTKQRMVPIAYCVALGLSKSYCQHLKPQ